MHTQAMPASGTRTPSGSTLSKTNNTANVCLLPTFANSLASHETAVACLRQDLTRLARQMNDCGELLALLAGLPVTNQTARRLDDLEQRVGCLLVDLSRLRFVAEAPALRESVAGTGKGDRT